MGGLVMTPPYEPVEIGLFQWAWVVSMVGFFFFSARVIVLWRATRHKKIAAAVWGLLLSVVLGISYLQVQQSIYELVVGTHDISVVFTPFRNLRSYVRVGENGNP